MNVHFEVISVPPSHLFKLGEVSVQKIFLYDWKLPSKYLPQTLPGPTTKMILEAIFDSFNKTVSRTAQKIDLTHGTPREISAAIHRVQKNDLNSMHYPVYKIISPCTDTPLPRLVGAALERHNRRVLGMRRAALPRGNAALISHHNRTIKAEAFMRRS